MSNAKKIIFQDGIYQFPTHYKLTDLGNGIFNIEHAPGVITQAGTALTADTLNSIADEVIYYIEDTANVANAYTGNLTGLISYVKGLRLILVPNTNSTGLSNLNLNGLGVKNIKKIVEASGKENTEINDFIKGKPALLLYDGVDFQLVNPTAELSAITTIVNSLKADVSSLRTDVNNVKSDTIKLLNSSGLVNAYIVNDPSVTTLYAGLKRKVIINTTNTGASTFKINNLEVKNINFANESLKGGELQGIVSLNFDGISWQLEPTAFQIKNFNAKLADIKNEIENDKVGTITSSDSVINLLNAVDGMMNVEISGETKVIDGKLVSVGEKQTDGQYKIEVLSTSRNKFDKSKATKKAFVNSLGIVALSDDWVCSDYMYIKPNTQYIGKSYVDWVYYAFYDINKKIIGYHETMSTILTSLSNAVYIRYSYRLVGESVDDFQFEEGTTLTSYTSYQEDKIDILTSKPLGIGSKISGNTVTYADSTTQKLNKPLTLSCFKNGSLIINSGDVQPSVTVNYPLNVAASISSLNNGLNQVEERTEEALNVANAAFQSASNAKILLSSALLAKGQNVVSKAPFQEFVDEIGNIIPFISGKTTLDATKEIYINTINFKPNLLILVISYGFSYYYMERIIRKDDAGGAERLSLDTKGYSAGGTGLESIFSNNGFRVKIDSSNCPAGSNVNWYIAG